MGKKDKGNEEKLGQSFLDTEKAMEEWVEAYLDNLREEAKKSAWLQWARFRLHYFWEYCVTKIIPAILSVSKGTRLAWLKMQLRRRQSSSPKDQYK